MFRTPRPLRCIGRKSKQTTADPKQGRGEGCVSSLPLTSGNQPAHAGSSRNLVAETAAERIVPAVAAPIAIARTEVARTRIGRLRVMGVVIRIPVAIIIVIVVVGARCRDTAGRHARRHRRDARRGSNDVSTLMSQVSANLIGPFTERKAW